MMAAEEDAEDVLIEALNTRFAAMALRQCIQL